MRRNGKSRPPQANKLNTYWDRAQWPIHGLYFLSPLLIAYELGTWLYAPRSNEQLPHIWAERLLGDFFELLGATGYYLPGILVVAVLLAWHALRRESWLPEPKLYLIMLIESVALAVPLFVFSILINRATDIPTTMSIGTIEWLSAFHPLPAAATAAETLENIPSWHVGIVLSIGAGIYEELLFRLIAIALLHLLLVDLLAIPDSYGSAAAVLISAVAFALSHFSETNPFQMARFAFYTLAGVYFASIFVLRGFGIVAATHAIYDVLVVTVLFMQNVGHTTP